MKIGAAVGLVASLLAFLTGDMSAHKVAQKQPMKLAAMEALYNGGTDQSLTAVAWVNPFKQADYEKGEEPPLRIGIPYALSFLATHDFHGFVPGINDIIRGGYTNADGEVEPSLEEKMRRGKEAITTLNAYRKLKDETKGNPTDAQLAQLKEYATSLNANMKYFGYGYIKDASQVVPNVPINFWSFRVMVGFGTIFILFFLVVMWMLKKKDISKKKWLLKLGILLVPCVYLASEAGWLVAEFGRQPWTIQDMMPTWVAVSDINAGSVMLTFFLFLALFTTMLIVEINILCKQIKRGPEYSSPIS